VNVFVPGPNTSPVFLCVIKGLKISLVGTVPIKDPSPAIEDHFEFDVPAHGRKGFKVGNGDDATMTVHHLSRVHLRQNGEVDPLPPDEALEKVPRFLSTRLIHFGCIDKSEPYCKFDFFILARKIEASEEPVPVKYTEYGYSYGHTFWFFWDDQQIISCQPGVVLAITKFDGGASGGPEASNTIGVELASG
jgi:hypothetical protein